MEGRTSIESFIRRLGILTFAQLETAAIGKSAEFQALAVNTSQIILSMKQKMGYKEGLRKDWFRLHPQCWHKCLAELGVQNHHYFST